MPVKNFNLFLRRTHLYLGMLLIPWVFVFAFSTFIFNHGNSFSGSRGNADDWQQVWQKEYQLEIPEGRENLRRTASVLLSEHGINGPRFGVRRNGPRMEINIQKFLSPERLVYHGRDQKLIYQKRSVFWAEVFSRLHLRHGWGNDGPLYQSWALLVDVFCLATLAWIFTGLYLWWKISATRKWGFIALLSGFLSFGILLLTL